MINYNIVKYCGLCRKRFVVGKDQARKRFCNKCQLKINKEMEVKK